MKNLIKFISAACALGLVTAQGQNEGQDCAGVSAAITNGIGADRSEVLNIVSQQLEQSPGCACEIVKAAIKASEAECKMVAAIVEAGISAAPEQMRLISQCAIATAPDAIAEVRAVLAKLDPNSGDSGISSKSSKSSKAPAYDAADEGWNPLDFPGDGEGVVNGGNFNSGARQTISVNPITDPNP